jgi:hypothetical protein
MARSHLIGGVCHSDPAVAGEESQINSGSLALPLEEIVRDVSLNSPQDESAVADMTNLFCIYEMVSNLIQKPAMRWIIQKAATLPMLYGARRHAQVG